VAAGMLYGVNLDFGDATVRHVWPVFLGPVTRQ